MGIEIVVYFSPQAVLEWMFWYSDTGMLLLGVHFADETLNYSLEQTTSMPSACLCQALCARSARLQITLANCDC